MKTAGFTRRESALVAAIALWAIAADAACPDAFVPGEIFDAGRNRGMCVVADLDGDGDLDLSTGATALLGDGAGGLETPLLLAEDPDASVFDALVDDFDGDGRPDVAFVSIGAPYVSMLFGRRRESPADDLFEPPVLVPCVQSAWHLALGDIDGNGSLDIAVGSMNLPHLSLLLNGGQRTFRTMTLDSMPHLTHALALGDFDGDRHLDIASGWGRCASLLFGNGDGTFAEPATTDRLFEDLRMFMHRFKAADFDGDARADLVVCADVGARVYPGASIERGPGLVPESGVELELDGIGRYVELADMSCDGLLDVVALSDADHACLRVHCGVAPTPEAPVAFTCGESFSPTATGPMMVPALGDMNGDGAIDVVLISELTGQGQVLFGTQACRLAAAGDANGDGELTIADPIVILSHLFARLAARCPGAMEVNRDGAVNIADAVFLLAHLFAHGPEPTGSPQPCPAGG